MNKKQFSLLLMLSLLAGLVGGMLTSQFFLGTPVLAEKKVGAQNVIVAEEFRLVDKEDNILSTWGMYAGGPGIVLFGKNGQFRAVFSLTSPDEGPILTFADNKGNHRATVGLGAGRQPYVTLRDQTGNERISLSLDDDGDPYLALYDQAENERAVLGTMDSTKLKRTGTIEKRSVSSLVLLGKDGQITWKTP
ncbi:MAG: hypothetical protein WBF55_08610 [Syntrophobacteria bacterium]|jgi:hypothetical protein|nr:hypothetical protein [Deltaproteobacteria bacterium]PNV84898.1 MAG: hypothetical protein C0610_14575 [Desulfobacteraceae bacterium]MDH3773584.1 hypothetical protein [Deltaproteobacteria bacterium]MDH3851310.1 hypothetical protein [Deltaproteobacteria bacterium]MDH3898206.1 hypothetical protein [Deltaproteobacteria bacterium]